MTKQLGRHFIAFTLAIAFPLASTGTAHAAQGQETPVTEAVTVPANSLIPFEGETPAFFPNVTLVSDNPQSSPDEAETRKVADGAAGAAAVGPFWRAVPAPYGPAIGIWWEKNALDVTETATRAVTSGTCVELKVGYIGASGVIGVSPAEYTDGCA